MLYLDTHVVIWLYEGLLEKFSKQATELLQENEIKISPMVSMELQYLYEIKRSAKPADTIIDELQQQIGLEICNLPFYDIIKLVNKLNWTRDPFDRIIVANAMVNNSYLLTKDNLIHEHYQLAIW